jgi:hypothetical protein
LYWIDPNGGSYDDAFEAYCNMDLLGGGWTLVAVYGDGDRPQAFTGNQYPRPGAANYGSVSGQIFTANANTDGITNYSIDAAELYDRSSREVIFYAGGAVDNWLRITLPVGCNFFDGSSTCAENTLGPFSVYQSNGSLLTASGYACTTANAQEPFQTDPADEMGLQLLDGIETTANHCASTASVTGVGNDGRLFSTGEGSNGQNWGGGVNSSWAAAGVPGAILIR